MQTTSSSLQQQEKQDVSHIKNILDNKSLTFAEKVISIKNVETRNKRSQIISMAGDIVIVDVDLAMAQDSTGPLAIRSINEIGKDKLQDP
jgi:homoaconitase/3-isopropylmalate dehydratase large subunit